MKLFFKSPLFWIILGILQLTCINLYYPDIIWLLFLAGSLVSFYNAYEADKTFKAIKDALTILQKCKKGEDIDELVKQYSQKWKTPRKIKHAKRVVFFIKEANNDWDKFKRKYL